MKKKALCPLGYAVVIAVFLLLQQSIHSQVSNPSSWDSFVQGNTNTVVTDTFRMQTFEGLPTDNWNYTTKGATSIVETSLLQIKGKSGKYALRMPMDTEISFDHYPVDSYQNICINIHKGGTGREVGDNLMIRAYRPGDPDLIEIVSCKNKEEICSFDKPKKEDPSLLEPNITKVSRNPPGIDLVTSKPLTYSESSYYCVDSIYAYGQIPLYSLFSATGNWNNTSYWSHLPAERHRNALINGTVSVQSETYCNNLHIGNGSVRILPSAHLSINNLSLYSDDSNQASTNKAPLLSSGSIEIKGTVTVEKTFSQKGKWYFISFPFDIYAEGIDPGFQLGDGSETHGNYFYLKTYNGEKRALQQSATGNWETIPRSSLSSNKPLLQKGRGYLIALDESANRQTLRFTSKPNDLPSDFARNGASSISITLNEQSSNKGHQGWYLCGNPFPSILPLSQINPNKSLDGFVYLYNGSTYKAYEINSDFAIPPFSAFFVKASENTEITIQDISLSQNLRSTLASQPLSFLPMEPGSSSVENTSADSSRFTFYVSDRILHILNLRAPGIIQILSADGKPMYHSTIVPGDSNIPIPLSKGIYILVVEAGQDQTRHKFILT